MAVIESLDSGSGSGSTRTPLPKPPPRAGDFSYAPTDRPRDLDETLKSWDSVPLFMKDLPTDGTDDGTQTALDALQSLAFDGTPDEVAANFKQQADDYFRARRFREALGFYTQAIDAAPTDASLHETLLANRAACNLELSNYGQTLRDTSAVLALNANNEKAYYRAARALIALDRCRDAVDCCEHALGVNPNNQPIRALQTKAQTRLAQLERSAAEAAERKRRTEAMAKAVQQALVVRGLWLETTPRPPDNPTPAHFDAACLAPEPALVGEEAKRWAVPDVVRTPLVVPVVFMYPQHAQSDFVSDYHEDTPLADYMATIFPAESRGSLAWDSRAEYYDANLVVYATTRHHRLLKLGRKLSLRQVMDHAYREAAPGADKVRDRDGLVMQDGILSLIVVPKGPAEQEWIAKFKAQREKTSD